jgi:hypothetical protein
VATREERRLEKLDALAAGREATLGALMDGLGQDAGYDPASDPYSLMNLDLAERRADQRAPSMLSPDRATRVAAIARVERRHAETAHADAVIRREVEKAKAEGQFDPDEYDASFAALVYAQAEEDVPLEVLAGEDLLPDEVSEIASEVTAEWSDWQAA